LISKISEMVKPMTEKLRAERGKFMKEFAKSVVITTTQQEDIKQCTRDFIWDLKTSKTPNILRRNQYAFRMYILALRQVGAIPEASYRELRRMVCEIYNEKMELFHKYNSESNEIISHIFDDLEEIEVINLDD